ncbi:1-acyl-sn-glycerol-3-phosphate acyltransferase [Leclercia adecarboxylata]|uniref:1-acyl-sn-glycerol-3-phosphate acyltransferase n=1 Tax=Leclercia adecarboxylata TaxID=83655 RepID=A0A4U9IMG1_9ENTR|nr:1-acyl-sn-glycerol-3-phosphate acyltransferase [Leclercia adecarboxylata]
MLLIVRSILAVIYCILVCIFGCIYCLFSPRNPKHVATFGHMFARLGPLFGLKVETRLPEGAEKHGNAIYIGNHQNNYDMVTAAKNRSATYRHRGQKKPAVGAVLWPALLADRQPADRP